MKRLLSTTAIAAALGAASMAIAVPGALAQQGGDQQSEQAKQDSNQQSGGSTEQQGQSSENGQQPGQEASSGSSSSPAGPKMGGAGQGNDEQSPEAARTSIEVTSASDITGRFAVDKSDQDIGKVEYLMINAVSGDVDYLILGSDAKFDIGDKVVAVPWNEQTDPSLSGDRELRIEVSADELKKAPHFDRSKLSSLIEPTAIRQIIEYYATPGGGGQQSGGAQGSQGQQSAQNGGQGEQNGQTHLLVGRRVVEAVVPAPVANAGALQNAVVRTANGNEIGQIDKIMIDMDAGKVAYLLMVRGEQLGLGGEWVPIPIEALTWSPQQDSFTLDVRTAQLQPMRGYPKQALPARVSTEQLASLYEHYGVTPYWEGGQAAIASRPPEARQGFAQGYGAGGYNGPPQQFGNGSSGQYPSYGGGPGYQGYQGYGPGQAYNQGQAYGQGYGNPGYGPGGQRYAQGQGYGPQGYAQYPQQGQGYGQYPQQSQGYGPSGPPMMGGQGQMGGMANNPQPQMRRMMRQHMQQYGTGQGYGPSGPPMMRGQGQMGSMGQGYGPPSGSSQPQQPGYGPMGPGYGQSSPQNGGGQQ